MIGKTDDGFVVAGELSVMRPADLLGVTDEDIWRLEREGKLDDASLDGVTLRPTAEPEPVGAKGERGGG